MPSIISGATNARPIMIGGRAAESIRAGIKWMVDTHAHFPNSPCQSSLAEIADRRLVDAYAHCADRETSTVSCLSRWMPSFFYRRPTPSQPSSSTGGFSPAASLRNLNTYETTTHFNAKVPWWAVLHRRGELFAHPVKLEVSKDSRAAYHPVDFARQCVSANREKQKTSERPRVRVGLPLLARRLRVGTSEPSQPVQR